MNIIAFFPTTAPNYILSYYNARSSGNRLDLHINSYVPNPGPWCTAMQVVYMLDDTSERNGCTVVVPGSHRSGEFTDRSLRNVVPIIASAGDLVVWDSRLLARHHRECRRHFALGTGRNPDAMVDEAKDGYATLVAGKYLSSA